MNLSKDRLKIIGASAGVALVIGLVVTWRVSRSHANARAAELLSASADMVRCIGGDSVSLDRASVEHAFHRRLVTTLPDVIPVSDCPQAMETVQEKLAAHDSVWFGSMGSKGKDGQPLRARVKAAVDGINAVPFNVPANKVLAKREQHAKVLQLPALSMDLFLAVEELYGKEGADDKDVAAARDKRLRQARKAADNAPVGKVIGTVPGKVTPDQWNIIPGGDKNQMMLHALSDAGHGLVAATDSGGQKWDAATGAVVIGKQSDPWLVAWYGPNGDHWVTGSHADPAKKAKVFAAKVPIGAAALPALAPMPDPPGDWYRSPGGERELGVLPDGTFVYPVQRLAEKTKEMKKEEEKAQKYWQKHLNDKDVQAAIQLNDVRMNVRKSLNVDDEHFALDGVAYAGKGEQVVRELPGYGLIAMVEGAETTLVLGKDAVPSQVVYSTKLPPAGEPLGMMATATTDKMVTTAFRASRTYKCRGADGVDYGISDRGLELLMLRPGALEATFIKVDVPEGTRFGCGESTAVMPLPFQADRIFDDVLTVRGGEVEGARAAMTSGTHTDEYNKTATAAIIPGAILVAWVAEGYVEGVVSKNWGTQFEAPSLLGESTKDSKVVGVRAIGHGTRIFVVIAREKCAGNTCTTQFEGLVSEDQAKTWHST